MIIGVSIVDMHKEGDGHVGTYFFEVDYPGNSHFDLMALVVPVENEHIAKASLNRLMSAKDMGPNPVRVPITEAREV